MLPAIVVAVVFGSALMVVKMALDFNRDKMLAESSREGSSLRVSELEELIEAAVEKAVAPLHERLEELELRQLSEAASQKMLSGGKEESTTHSDQA